MATHAHSGSGQGAVRDANRRRLTIVLVLAISYSLVELGGGIWTSSLALLADAFHLLSDVAALAISLFAVWMAQRPATAQRTFGHSRAEILAALANGVGLAVMALMVSVNAVERLQTPAEVRGLGVVAFASGALVYECVSLWVLHRGAEQNLNVRGAFLHVLGDALGSLGAIVAGLAVWARGWHWADSIASLGISALVLYSAWRLVREAVDILMEAAPAHLDVEEIRENLAALAGVRSVHDLHVWTVGSGEVSLSSHVVTDPQANGEQVLHRVRAMLRDRFDVTHTTVQVESGEPAGEVDADCEGACDDAALGSGSGG